MISVDEILYKLREMKASQVGISRYGRRDGTILLARDVGATLAHYPEAADMIIATRLCRALQISNYDKLDFLGVVRETIIRLSIIPVEPPWSLTWPEENGFFWFYGWTMMPRWRAGYAPKPHFVKVGKIVNGYMHVTKGNFLYEASAFGVWQPVTLPDLPDYLEVWPENEEIEDENA